LQSLAVLGATKRRARGVPTRKTGRMISSTKGYGFTASPPGAPIANNLNRAPSKSRRWPSKGVRCLFCESEGKATWDALAGKDYSRELLEKVKGLIAAAR